MLTDLESETVERSRAFDKAEKMGQAISGEINGEIITSNGEIKPETGEITGEIKILDAISKNPGIKRERLRAITGISLRTIDRIVKRLTDDEKIEYRGSKRTGGWYVKT